MQGETHILLEPVDRFSLSGHLPRSFQPFLKVAEGLPTVDPGGRPISLCQDGSITTSQTPGLQARASLHFNQTITAAFITVPWDYTDDQCAALHGLGRRSSAASYLIPPFISHFLNHKRHRFIFYHPIVLMYMENSIPSYHLDFAYGVQGSSS
ncbi:hypothetical protein E1B28_002560 [Marasmius oreades]|uniref:Uncharacterized protein n=1 Tax=Marasmius oreades TaxID=181124 RepID=A0A9P7RNX0_9AGAR|nr:uncharacterized protein E1B28_002560 [Marasmius oreades]KAG7086616.1 hypothetical protein E1B28_002560 [Marasmius oreades]